MQFSSSLKLNHIFRRLYRKGSSAANGYLVLYCRKNGSQANRIGLTVSAKLAHAVQRNRLRRQLREIYRLHETSFSRGYDLVVVARSRAIGADYAALEHARACRRPFPFRSLRCGTCMAVRSSSPQAAAARQDCRTASFPASSSRRTAHCFARGCSTAATAACSGAMKALLPTASVWKRRRSGS